MTVETETILLKLLEELKAESKETNKRLNSIEVNQVRLEGEVKSVQVEIKYIREDTQDLKTIYKWLIGLIITFGIGAGTIFFRIFDLFPKA